MKGLPSHEGAGTSFGIEVYASLFSATTRPKKWVDVIIRVGFIIGVVYLVTLLISFFIATNSALLRRYHFNFLSD